ncbi:5-formyltetrahydrofolate cyclo-ligase [Jeotgalibacillus sp. R-1-5s-1]|uniref:5-formyltetrahydrofolate cyclo-ligase n=1 Tax=Jeotgalibacillus sp. R-1-5s-1 TaxID=2555897 RepID=UPI00141BCC5E|nr:5-formyltetrahydrofolate cyclo-ligase [Jeotgalibacillus sp. R-1-5s-1]
MTLDKKDLRKNMLQQMKDLSADDRICLTERVYERLFQTDEWRNAQTVGLTVSTGSELETRPVIERAFQDGKTVAVPRCIPSQKVLVFHEIKDITDVKPSFFNLLEPPESLPVIHKDDIDLLIVPGLIFDPAGYRIGFGGGYYDRFLTDYRNMTAALSFRFQVMDQIPRESHDIPVKKLITD